MCNDSYSWCDNVNKEVGDVRAHEKGEERPGRYWVAYADVLLNKSL